MKWPPLPKKRYQIIYADPPWFYTRQQHTKTKASGGAETHYPTLTLQQLKKFPIQQLIDWSGCLLFLWATGPRLDWAVDLLRYWKFYYKTVAFVWDKGKPNPGYYTMSQCEYVLLGKIGKIPTPRGARNLRQLVRWPRQEHSKKPLAVRSRIAEMFPTQTKIELFARERYEGWDAWGLEV